MSRASVHWNLHREAFSIKVGSAPVYYAAQVTLANATFHIDARLRAQFDAKPSRRTVHALVRGDLVSIDPQPALVGGEQIRCNPFLFASFVRASDETRVDCAELVVLHASRCMEARNATVDAVRR